MKLIIAIVQDEDASRLVSALMNDGYGVTKLAAEDLCRLFNHLHGLPVLVMRTSRFFPEEDDMAHAITSDERDRQLSALLPPVPLILSAPAPVVRMVLLLPDTFTP